MAVVWDEETLVDAYDHVEVDDDDLDRKIEDVEACFALIVGWVGPRSFPACVIGTCSERRTCTEENGSRD